MGRPNGPGNATWKAGVYLLAENRLLRETLSRLLQKKTEFRVVGEGAYSDAVIEQVLASQCDILLLDGVTRVHAGTDLIHELLRALPDLRVLLIGMEEEEETFVRAVRSGVAGYLLKDASAMEVVAAVRAVTQGEAVCPPRLCQALFHYIAQQAREGTVPAVQAELGLTPRQQQLVSLVAQGLTNKEIADHLHLSEQTVKNHVHRILRQVHARSRSEIVATVRNCGFSS
ncbi:MAG: response regulator transcription factor [Acidobacteriia bacterium]|nr:response regulator transcription factor [Terriglobia bacterium]